MRGTIATFALSNFGGRLPTCQHDKAAHVTLSELVRKGIEHIDQPRFSTWLNLQRAGKPLFERLSAYQLDLMQSLERTWLSANPTPKQHEEKGSHMEDHLIWTHLVKFMETQLQQNPEVDTLLLHEPTHFASASEERALGKWLHQQHSRCRSRDGKQLSSSQVALLRALYPGGRFPKSWWEHSTAKVDAMVSVLALPMRRTRP